ncbi:hypothetical protein C9446_12430 [Providencia heimbachae]|uniref:phosphoethanolamine transferase n=1 Tax=Providencia heimbachae TaxID=333962 RepID=UPI0010BE8460|nr:phosphoethanolamine transferase [Providencia heimbachae]QCJ70587.1 hypothetical protein C9446_12430 [Providencia heimbachae]
MQLKLQALKNKNYSKIALLFLFICLSHISLGFDFKIIYAISVFFLFLSINAIRPLYTLLIILLALISAMYLPVAMLYGEPNFNIATSLLYTNKIESLEFASNIPYYYYLLSVAILALGFYLSRYQFKVKLTWKLVFVSLFLIIFLQGAFKSWSKEDEFSLANTGLPEVKFLKQSVQAIISSLSEKKKMDEMLKHQDDYPLLESHSNYDTYVLVIGESVRKDFMHSYGFEIANTPFLDNLKGKIFTNYISAAPATVPSLTNTIAEYSKLQNNIVTLSNKANIHTYWLSNQGAIGENDSPIASIGKRANQSIFIKNGDYTSAEPDYKLLPYINDAINEGKGTKKLIIVHLIGSHTPACKRTENKYDLFYLSNRVSCYVQSIKNTDELLHSVYDALKASNTKWSMMYFSDHGVSFSNKENRSKLDLIHGYSHKQNFEAPFFIASYDDQETEVIDARISGFDFLPLFTEWLGIDHYQNPNCKMISNQNCKFNNRVLGFDNTLMNFDLLPDDSL